MKKLLLLFAIIIAGSTVLAQDTRQAFYYCADHVNKVLYYRTGKAVVKKGLQDKDNYQYGFMKQMGWINRNWAELSYNIQFYSPRSTGAMNRQADSLKHSFRIKDYVIREVQMPYPMKPFVGYKKDGTN